MDTRIGYPTEHLANNNTEAMKSPMYATGIGLVLQGFEDYEKSLGRTGAQEPASTGEVKTHSKKTKGGFFDEIVKRMGGFFVEEDEESESNNN